MLDALVVRPGSHADLEQRDPRYTLNLPGKEGAATQLDGLLEELSSLQERLYFNTVVPSSVSSRSNSTIRSGRGRTSSGASPSTRTVTTSS